ncbi:substrate-binding periplasmic protein [Litoribrevibacter albus]|uniref:Solute-binding protein family 3/N-terminal domain-containing protein n=1 Tax=Litoribrevibacter albus TaxID=1473156 RepID=A0AA37W8X6_9GAMM|nr:ABC transporter substrate-binding protein [Litoribrevibacter albus]GLQ32519.1 hypothetical protein GCM10007876_29980 [Litoribrevibacter albus]
MMLSRVASVFLLYLWMLPVWSGEVITLVTHEYKPYSWVDNASGEVKGLTVEIANLMFERAKVKKSWKIMPSKRAYNYAKSKSNTCIFPLQRNQEREADFKWVGPIMINKYAFYTLADADIALETLEDVKKYTVVTYLGSGLREYLSGFGINTIEALKDEVAATMVSIGRVPVWATDVFSAPYTIGQQTKAFDEEYVFFTSLSAMACHRGMSDEMVNRLQSELTQLYKTQEIAKIVRRYER